jgi:hypothetical protein
MDCTPLGNAYRTVGLEPEHASVLFQVLQEPVAKLREMAPGPELSRLNPAAAAQAIDAAMSPLAGSRMARPDANLVRHEFDYTARLLRHAVRRAALGTGDSPSEARVALAKDAAELGELHRVLWLARSRPGGWPDSAAILERMAPDYA